MFLRCFFTIISLNLYANSIAVIDTSFGEIELQLFDKKAPITVQNFKSYIKKGFYDNTIFHRVIDNFMIQGGGYTTSLEEKENSPAIKNEALNKISNDEGTIAMARTRVVDSATSQFFINVKDNHFLNNKGTAVRDYGYAVFGKVIKGMAVINRIKKSQTKRNGPHQNLPIENIIIKKIYLKKKI